MEKLTIDSFTVEVLDRSLLCLTWRGPMTARGVRELLPYIEAARSELGPDALSNCLLLAEEATGIDRAARTEIVNFARMHPFVRVGLVGVRFELAVLIELTIKGLKLMKLQVSEVRQFGSEAEAKAWLSGA